MTWNSEPRRASIAVASARGTGPPAMETDMSGTKVITPCHMTKQQSLHRGAVPMFHLLRGGRADGRASLPRRLHQRHCVRGTLQPSDTAKHLLCALQHSGLPSKVSLAKHCLENRVTHLVQIWVKGQEVRSF